MARKKGSVKTGGRKAGTPNITTKRAKMIMDSILFTELKNIKSALKVIRGNDEAKYIDCLSKLLNYSLPKKTDLTSHDEPLPAAINITVASLKGQKELKEFLDGTDNK